MPKQTTTGKAYEYACLHAFRRALAAAGADLQIKADKSYMTAAAAFEALAAEQRTNYKAAADTAARLILPLEPRLVDVPGSGSLEISITSNQIARGAKGDVRDIICVRGDGWEVGFSCKHNHTALRHPRITEAKDFGAAWLGVPCSVSFVERMNDILRPLKEMKGKRWRELPEKQEVFYAPTLSAFLTEFKRLCAANADIPGRLLSYFFGSQDFYKIIDLEAQRQTKIIGVNIGGTLNAASATTAPIYNVPKLKMPHRLIDADFKSKSKTTIILTFDGGWSVSLRLHNKDEFIRETGLAFDVQLVGLPSSAYQQQSSWDE